MTGREVLAAVLAAGLAGPVVAAPPAAAGPEVRFVKAGGEVLSLDALVPRLAATRYLLLGEEHGNYSHHAVQRDIIAALAGSGRDLAAGMEAFPVTATDSLALWTAGRLDTADLFRLFDKGWNLDNWPMYRDLLFLFRERGIPLAGINADEALVRRVARGGMASLGKEEVRALPEVSCDGDGAYLLLAAGAGAAREAHPPDLRRFCEAQMLRDAVMARQLEAAAREKPHRMVVGIMGRFHAWKPGVPAQLARLTGEAVTVILPATGDGAADREALAGQADYLWRSEGLEK